MDLYERYLNLKAHRNPKARLHEKEHLLGRFDPFNYIILIEIPDVFQSGNNKGLMIIFYLYPHNKLLCLCNSGEQPRPSAKIV